MASPLLKVTDLRAGYGRAEVLHGLSLQADKGSVITVIGPNGAGKCTLLGSLMGLLPSQGRIEFDGQDIGALTLEERVMLGIALVPEKRELFGTMSVEDNLVLGGFRQMRLGNAEWRKLSAKEQLALLEQNEPFGARRQKVRLRKLLAAQDAAPTQARAEDAAGKRKRKRHH